MAKHTGGGRINALNTHSTSTGKGGDFTVNSTGDFNEAQRGGKGSNQLEQGPRVGGDLKPEAVKVP